MSASGDDTGAWRPPSPAQIQEFVRKQIATMTDDDRTQMVRIIEEIQRRQDARPVDKALRFDLLGEDWFTGHAVARGQVVVATGNDKARIGNVLKGLGYDPAQLRGAGVRAEQNTATTVYYGNGKRPERIAEDIATLKGQGITAGFNLIVPLGQHTIKAANLPMPVGPPANRQPPQPAPDPDNRTVRIAVIDTGIDRTDRGDSWLDNIRRTGQNEDPADPPAAGETRLGVDQGHGSFVGGVVEQVSPGCQVRAYRFTGPDGLGTETDIANALRQAVTDAKADNVRLIVNMSFGAAIVGDLQPTSLTDAVGWVKTQHPDVLLVAAVGNDGGPEMYPASDNEVVGVAALNADYTAADFSGRGAAVTCSTVGVGIVSTFVTGDMPPVPIDDVTDYAFPVDAWAVWSGTSFACPQICAEVANLCLNEAGLAPKAAFDRLMDGATPLADYGRVVRGLLPGTSV